MKAILISLDMIMALPFACLAILLLFSAFYGSQAYLSNSSQSSEEMIALYYRSQFITDVVSAQGMTYSLAYSFLTSYSKSYGLDFFLSPYGSTPASGCGYSQICRIETISGASYLLRISNGP